MNANRKCISLQFGTFTVLLFLCFSNTKITAQDAEDANLPKEIACDNRGYSLGTGCLRTPDCEEQTRFNVRDDPWSSSTARRRVCIRGTCCLVPKLNGGGTSWDATNQRGGQVPTGVAGFCSNGGTFTKFTGRLCEPLNAAVCPTVSGYDGQAVVQLQVQCIRGYCCSTEQPSTSSSRRQYDPQENQHGPLPIRPQASRALCFDGTESSQQCRSATDCTASSTVCVQGLCCPMKRDERNFVCGGLSAVSNCFANNQCNDDLVCTASNYCCECHYGQPQPTVKCSTTNSCKSEYECTPRGYCCPRCADNLEPYGSCFSGKCASGFSCHPGNICCPNSSILS